LSAELDSDVPTYAALSVWVDGTPVWPVAGDEDATVDIFIDDILDYLADFWLPLTLRQTYPVPLDEPPERPSSLAAVLRARWLRCPESTAEAEQASAAAFEAAHNFATCFDGQFGLPALWLLRERDYFLIDTDERLWRVPFEPAMEALVAFGDLIAGRLQRIASRDWSALVTAWRTRETSTGTHMLQLSAGLSAIKADELLRSGHLTAPKTFFEAANDNDEIRIAARIAGALPTEEIKRVISLARGFKLRPAPLLNNLRTEVRRELESHYVRLKPHELGEAAARLVRSACKIEEAAVLDVRALSASLGVEVKEYKLSLRALMGLAITGERHGPGVLLNRQGHHLAYASAASRESMLRYTLAHELCHLLLDGGHAFTAVDVLKGRMSPALESRAQSFAGELLLPTRTAAAIWEKHTRPVGAEALNAVILECIQVYQVTRSVAAWKIEHAAIAVDVDLHSVLSTLARYR
jgi:hypothetical protein